jgi:hypothetical protein
MLSYCHNWNRYPGYKLQHIVRGVLSKPWAVNEYDVVCIV